MPLLSGEKNIGRNIKELESTGKYSHKQAIAIALSKSRDGSDSETSREYDLNGWAEIKGNPISKVGIFPYLGAQISDELIPDKIYKVYRPEAELNNAETINSFRLLPWTNEHAMLGDGQMPAEQKGVHGVIGEDVYFEGGYLKANLKVFSEELADLINSGKKELSIGYRCVYDLTPGVYEGESYDVVQRDIRGNHIALVEEGRSGKDIAVLDHFKITFDSKDLKMPDFEQENYEDKMGDMSKPADAKDEGEMSIVECREMLKKIAEHLERMSESKDEFLDDEEAEEANESENVIDEDVEPADFVKKAEVTDADEEEEVKEELSKKAAMAGDSMKSVLKEISRRDALAERLSRHVGTFDHKDLTVQEVAKYGVKKLGLYCSKGHEEAVLSGYLQGARASQAVALDSAKHVKSSAIDAYINGGK